MSAVINNPNGEVPAPAEKTRRVAERLLRTIAEGDAQHAKNGYEDGKKWAEEVASYGDLRLLVAEGFAAFDRDEAMDDYFEYLRELYRDAQCDPAVLSEPTYLDGFVSGAAAVLDAVLPLMPPTARVR